ncbi:hypothetical protein Tco_0042351, partial [Tanacetum coccineum]
DMYGKCGLISNARKVFDEGFVNVVAGTALLEIYWKCCDVGWFTETQRVFDDLTEMLELGHKADHNSVLTSFCYVKDMIHREQIHCRVIKEGLQSDMYIAINVYSQCGSSLKDFYKICSTVDIKNNLSCNAIISGFSNLGTCMEAL